MQSVDATQLDDLFDLTDLDQAIEAGYVRRQVHPTEPLAILNYTDRCSYDNAWNPVTLTCRGLIYHTGTGRVVARPFPKFFNYGQPGAPTLDLNGNVHVTDKLDGSLGVLYPLPAGGHAVATRGSFTSDQAAHATQVWQDRYAARFTPPPGWTILAEIVYPANRIVIDYGDLDDLILLGAVDTATGALFPPEQVYGWPGPVAQTFTCPTLADALALEPRPNAEGVVVCCLTSGHLVKIKQEEYVRLHRIVTGLTARTVWEHLLTGQPLADLITPLPDEFHPWVRDTAHQIMEWVEAEYTRLTAAYEATIERMRFPLHPPTRESRKEFALLAAGTADSWAMFRLLDGKAIWQELLKRARPEPTTPSGRSYGEDTA